MNLQNTVTLVNKYQQGSKKLALLRCEMGNQKYSCAVWALFGVFVIALWIGLYVGYVVPVQNSFKYLESQCTTTKGLLLTRNDNQPCPCMSSPCPAKPKTFPCVQIYVNYTLPQGGMRQAMLHYSEAVITNNCSYIPSCQQSEVLMSMEVNYYLSLRNNPKHPYKCFYHKDKETLAIDVNYSSERLSILLPFAVVLILLLCVASYLLYRRGCGCNAKRRPSRLSFLSHMDV